MQQIEAIRTLVVMNTVDRAIDVYKEVKNLTRNQSIKSILIHSRYRPQDREKKIHELLAEPKDGGTIAITTQVIEAGVDISSNVLFTEIAPWSSLVQRFGRCNRRGEYNESGGGHIYLINLSEDEKEQKKNARPYDLADLKNSQKLINYVNNVDPSSLKQLQDVHSQEYRDAMRLEHTHVIRYKDLLDLFDTTPDLAGNDIDISRFIRSGEELDVHVFWRDWPVKEKLDPNQDYAKAPHRDELCPVPVYQFEDFLKNKGDSVWRWDSLDQKWIKADRNSVYPGQTYLIRCNAGGYDPEIGWNAKSKESVNTVAISLEQKQEGYSDDYYSITAWVTISQHTDDVVKYVKEFIEALGIEGEWKESLLWAARWHDRGKAHRIFQEAIKNRPEPWNNNNDLAKAPEGFWGRYQRKHFRHELASALAMRQSNFSPLAVYLTAAHHGKVRLSIRSLPGEIPPENPQKLFARGIYDGDELPSTNLGDGIIADSIVLSLECMQLGRSKNNEPSWIEQMLKLRDEVGLFKLAFLEAVFRAADWRASKEDQNNA